MKKYAIVCVFGKYFIIVLIKAFSVPVIITFKSKVLFSVIIFIILLNGNFSILSPGVPVPSRPGDRDIVPVPVPEGINNKLKIKYIDFIKIYKKLSKNHNN